jgi:hypothetical protein
MLLLDVVAFMLLLYDLDLCSTLILYPYDITLCSSVVVL